MMWSLPSSSSLSFYCASHPEFSPSSSQACLLKVPRFRPVPGVHSPEFNAFSFGRLRECRRRCTTRIRAFDEDSFDFASFDNSVVNSAALYAISSSEGEDSDGEYALNHVAETSAQRLGRISKDQQRHKIKRGMFMNMGLITFLTMLLLLADCCAWKIVRLPLASFHLSRPFFISAALVSCAGYLCVPLFNSLKIHQTIKNHGPVRHHRKRATPTMGGLFFVPIGAAVAKVFTGFSSVEVSGAAAATLAFAAIGLVDDALCLFNSDKNGLSARLRLLLEAAVGTCFAFWLDGTSISSPYGMKMLVPLPAPLGLVFLGKLYLLLTSFCFVSMGNGVNLTDGLDGLAGGVSASAFVAMSIAVLPICPDLAVFGASMAGACVGFLTHNRYRASIFMGDTGSLALGAALAAMAACSGMFLPLLISSGIFVLEAASVIFQVGYYKISKVWNGRGKRFLKMAPFHHHLELSGLREPTIVGFAYILSSLLSLYASYIAFISV